MKRSLPALFAALILTCTPVHAAAPAPALALQNMPVVLQGYNDCGPASIAMVLGYYGLPHNVTVISRATKARPQDYMQVAAIHTYVSQLGLRTVQITGSRIDLVKNLIALGVPTIVLQYYREVGKVPHFRVVRGYDDRMGRLFLADPLLGYAYVSYADFDRLWNTQGRVAVAVYPPAMHGRVMTALGVRS